MKAEDSLLSRRCVVRLQLPLLQVLALLLLLLLLLLLVASSDAIAIAVRYIFDDSPVGGKYHGVCLRRSRP